MSIYKSIIGNRYGKLTVVEELHDGKRITRKCLCDCGNYVFTSKYKLENGMKKSCKYCSYEEIRLKNTTHGMSSTRLFRIYGKMIRRCYVPEEPAYKYYGERGIAICDEWKNDRTKFFEWALNNGYKDDLTIDRINVHGNYEPSNCRWVTQKEQALNRTNNVLITFNGKTKTLHEWAEEKNMNRATLLNRLKRWSIEDALTKPICKERRNHLTKRLSGGD